MQPFPAKSKLQTDWSYGAVEHSCNNRYESRDVRQNFCLIDVHCTLLYKPRGTKIEDTGLTPLCLLRNTSMEDNLALSISHWKSAAMCMILYMNTFIFGEQNNGICIIDTLCPSIYVIIFIKTLLCFQQEILIFWQSLNIP